MRKILILSFAIAAIAMTLKAQVQTGATVSYSVTGTGATSYNWTATGGTINADADANDNTVSVTWGAVGTGQLSVVPVSTNSCNGATQSVSVTITATLPVTLTIGAIASICPYEATNMSGGGDPNATLYLSGAVPSSNWSVTYSVDSGTSWHTATSSTVAANSAFLFDTNLTANATLVLRDWTVNGTTYTPVVASRPSQSVTVYTMPSVSTITPVLP